MSKWGRDQFGAAYVEYAFLLALIAVVCLSAVTLLGQGTHTNTSRSASSIVVAEQ
jgi:Flp pilus assembly pilin Flp